MDIVAESLSAKTLKSREVLVNGKDIMEYIRSKLSTAVEFNGVYSSLEEAEAAGAKFNGSIVIVGTTEYIWYEKDNKWHEIGDETAVGKLAVQISELSSNISAFGIKDTIYSIDKSHASPTTGIENTPNFKIYTSAFTDGEIYGFNIQRSNNKQYNQIDVGTQLSIVGSSASSASQITPQNTYVVSKGTVAYPNFGETFYVDMQHTANSIPLSVNMLYFYFFDGSAAKNARFDIYSFDAQYAPTFMAPSYYDISAYILSSNVPSKTYVQQKFNDAIDYANSVSANVDKLSSTVSNLSIDVDSISSNVDNLSTYLAYASLTSESTPEGMGGGFDRAGIRRIVFMPSYLGMGVHDELTSIVLKTKDKSLEPILTGDNQYGYIRVRKYSGLNDDGQLIGQSDKFHWPNTVTTNVEIPFSEKIKFEEPNAQYYFEFLSGTATTINENQLTAFGVSLYLVNASDPQLPTLSSHYYAMNWNQQANPQTNAIQPRWRPYLSANYRHMYSMAEVEGKVEEKFNELIGSSSDLSSASTINGAKKYAKNYTDNAINNIQVPTDLSAFTNSPGYLSAIPSSYKTYEQTKNDLSNNNYVVIGKDNDVSSVNTLYGAKAYAKDYVAEYVDQHSSKNQIHPLSAWEKTELSNYTLGNGEIAIATIDDNFKMKVGDGSSTFHQLPYFSNIINISQDAYAQLVIDEKIDPDMLYVVSSDYINAYGQQLKNLSAGIEENDAATYGQLLALSTLVIELSTKL